MMISRRLNAPLLIAAGAALFYFIGMAWLAHLAHGAVVVDTVPGPPLQAGGTGFSWELWVGLGLAAFAGVRAIIDDLLAFFRSEAPLTKTVIDDHIRDDLQLAHDKLDQIQAVVAKLIPNSKPQMVAPNPPTSTGGGASSMLAVLLLGGLVLGQGACAGTGATVKKEATYLEGCDAADASTIIAGMKALADDAKALKAGGDRVAAATDVIVQLALINAAWQHCKATSAQDAAAH